MTTTFKLHISREFNVMDQLTAAVIACFCLQKQFPLSAALVCDTDALKQAIAQHPRIAPESREKLYATLTHLQIDTKHEGFATQVQSFIDVLHAHQDKAHLIDLCISQFTEYGRGNQMFFQDPKLTKLICNITQIDAPCKVYNPFGGLGSFATGLAACEYHGDEYDPYTWALGVLRLEYYGISSAHYIQNDSINNWNCTADTFDLIITNPPIDMGSDHQALDEMIIEESLPALNPNGSLVFICSYNYIHEQAQDNLSHHTQRQRIIDNKHLKAIYEIPTDSKQFQILNPAKPRYLVELTQHAQEHVSFYITPKNYDNNGISLDEYKKIDVAFEEIIAHNYDLKGRRYYQKQKNQARVSDKKSTYYLSDLLVSTPGTTSATHPQTGFVFYSHNLASSAYNYTVEPETLGINTITPDMHKLTEPTLICAKMYTRIKPTYVLASEATPVYLGGEYITCQLREELPANTKIALNYLVFALNTSDAISQFKALSDDRAISSITLKNFMSICIPVPSRSKQKEQIAEGLQKEVSNLGLEINKLQADFLQTLSNRKHAMGQEAAQMRDLVNRFFRVFKKKGTLSLDTVIDNDTGVTSEEYGVSLKTHANMLNQMVASMLDDEKDNKPIKISLVDYFKKWCKDHPADGHFTWDFISDYANEPKSGPCIMIPQASLDQIMSNITANALTYAFTSRERKDYQIRIYLIEEGGQVCIRIINNGQPLHDSIRDKDIFQIGVTTKGNSSSTGTGVCQIKEIITKYGNEVTIIDEQEAEFPFGFDLTFETIEKED